MHTTEFIVPWLTEVETSVISRLRGDARFWNAEQAIGRFAANVERWRNGGNVRAIIEDANELAAAAAILDIDSSEVRLTYEPRLADTPKTIDFRLEWPDGRLSWIDVKTVAPQWIDDERSWARFERIAQDFPDNAQLVTSRDWAGAAISGQEVKARWSFVQRTVETETKAALLRAEERGPVRLLLCSNGAFHKDGLEDFADFYKTGRFRADDWSRNAIARYMQDEGVTFARSLAGFCFLERHASSALASELAIDVRGPSLP